MSKFIELTLVGTTASKVTVNIEKIQFIEEISNGTKINMSTSLSSGEPYWLRVTASYEFVKKEISKS